MKATKIATTRPVAAVAWGLEYRQVWGQRGEQAVAGVAGGAVSGSDTPAGALASVSTGMMVAENAVEFNAVNKKQAGIPDGFEEVMNTSGRKIGLAKGDKAEEYLLEFAEIEWFKPTKTGYFNKRDHRYIYTEEGGWIDMVHFLFYAGTAYKEKKENIQIMTKYVGNTIADDQLHQISAEAAKSSGVRMGYKQEMFDALVARHSRFSYEDLPSDKFGADFGANYFDKNSPLSLGEQVNSYLTNRLKATLPTNAPNYKTLPEQEQGKHSGTFNYSTSPTFIKNREKNNDK